MRVKTIKTAIIIFIVLALLIHSPSACSIRSISMTENARGITVQNMNLQNNVQGVGSLFDTSSNNNVNQNNFTSNSQSGFYISSSSGNDVFSNNFENAEQVLLYSSANTWDNDYPSGGNYWSDDTGTDANGDGIGDTPYIIDSNNQDRYPLISPWTELPRYTTIYIRADGSIDPPTAPISTLDSVTYTLTADITFSSDGIIVERDNVIIDGNGYTLQGSGSGNGIRITGFRENVTVKNTNIQSFSYGINGEWDMSECSIFDNNITKCGVNLYLSSRSYGNISGNNISEGSSCGIWAGTFTQFNITGNTITNNCGDGLVVLSEYDSIISGNNVTNNVGIGINLMELYACNVTKNLVADNAGGGINMGLTGNIIVSQNTVTGNGGDGIYCFGLGNSQYLGNTIVNNRGAGVYISGPPGSASEVRGNTIAANDYGVWINEGVHVKIWHNNFLDNTNQAYVSSSTSVWDDGYPSGGNCWSDYAGVDANQDVIGDTPYVVDADNQDNYPLIREWPPFLTEA